VGLIASSLLSPKPSKIARSTQLPKPRFLPSRNFNGKILFGNLVLATITLAVMRGVLTVSDQAFGAMKWGGIAALLALAARMLLAKPAKDGSAPCAPHSVSELGAGLIVGLSSPYSLVFLLALLPQFVPAEMGVATITGVLGAVLCGAAVGQLGAVTVGLYSRSVLGARSCWFNRAGAVCLVGFAGSAMAVPLA
jgi:threonine/homoserine/homoserine lactone efflux protein